MIGTNILFPPESKESILETHHLLRKINIPPQTDLIVAINKLHTTSTGHSREIELNGWPSLPDEIDKFFLDHKNVGNELMLYEMLHKTYDYLRNMVLDHDFHHSSMIFPPHIIKHCPATIKQIELDKIPLSAKYIYPIQIRGLRFYDTKIATTIGTYLPDRVVADSKAGLCKIIFHQLEEGYSESLTKLNIMIEATCSNYDIPKKYIGFIDANYFTPYMQSKNGIKGFFYQHWEYELSFYITHSEMASIQKSMQDRREQKIDYIYHMICLNRRAHRHRICITMNIHKYWPDKILWSCNEKKDTDEIFNHPENFKDYISQLPKYIDVAFDTNDVDINLPLQNQACINLVTETHFSENALFLSEKIFKPLLSGQPFILVGPSGSLKLLREFGYKTFHPVIDESYDEIVDPELRMSKILLEIERLTKFSIPEMKKIDTQLSDICFHNYINILYRAKQKISMNKIITEIVEWL